MRSWAFWLVAGGIIERIVFADIRVLSQVCNRVFMA